MERKSKADYRDAAKLGDMLCSRPSTDEEKRERLLRLLAEFEETAVALLVNNRIKKYSNQTAVHIASKYGLSACLEILLKCGGMLISYDSFFNNNHNLYRLQAIQMRNHRKQISGRSVYCSRESHYLSAS